MLEDLFSNSCLFVSYASLAAISSLCCFRPSRSFGILLVPLFIIGWLIPELAWFHFLLQSLLTLLFVIYADFSDTLTYVAIPLSLISLLALRSMHRQSMQSKSVYRRALGKLSDIKLGRSALLTESGNPLWLRPFKLSRSDVQVLRNIRYAEQPRNLLDIHRRRSGNSKPAPVLLQIHGGAWIIGDKKQQGLPLMNYMASLGWVCVAINYRLSPKDKFPAHIVDVKKAIAWIKEHIHEYGGDPDFIVTTGESAGGHLCSLAALTPNLPEWQPGFEERDTQVNACVPIYGVYDFMDRNETRINVSMIPFLEEKVMQVSLEQNKALWSQASPVSHVNAAAPPMLIIHGSNDTLVFPHDARIFANALAATSQQQVIYVELPGTQHAFEIFNSVRSGYTVEAIAQFLTYHHQLYEQPTSEA